MFMTHSLRCYVIQIYRKSGASMIPWKFSGTATPPTSPKMTVPQGQVGVPMELKCESEGYPPPTIVWTIYLNESVGNTTTVVKVYLYCPLYSYHIGNIMNIMSKNLSENKSRTWAALMKLWKLEITNKCAIFWLKHTMSNDSYSWTVGEIQNKINSELDPQVPGVNEDILQSN